MCNYWKFLLLDLNIWCPVVHYCLYLVLISVSLDFYCSHLGTSLAGPICRVDKWETRCLSWVFRSIFCSAIAWAALLHWVARAAITRKNTRAIYIPSNISPQTFYTSPGLGLQSAGHLHFISCFVSAYSLFCSLKKTIFFFFSWWFCKMAAGRRLSLQGKNLCLRAQLIPTVHWKVHGYIVLHLWVNSRPQQLLIPRTAVCFVRRDSFWERM